MTPEPTVAAPDLPELEPGELAASGRPIELVLEGALVDGSGLDAVHATRIRIKESKLHGVGLETDGPVELLLADAVMHDCALSNVVGRGGTIKRSELRQSNLVGFDVSEGTVQDLRVIDCSLALSSFAFSQLRTVVFERANLAEASFMQATLEGVEFIDCRLAGADFRGARLKGCMIRGSSLDGILGVDALRGLTMPWADVVSSAAAMASALGIAVETD
jgi:uncharacterized protein YjbI with pentapeptide repeats